MSGRRLRKTKVIATIGPACDSPEVLKEMIHAGMNVARLNFSHGSPEEHRERLEMIRREMMAQRQTESRRRSDAMMADRDAGMAAGSGTNVRRGLDEKAQRRLEWLRAQQSKQGPGAPATAEERIFTFEEDDADATSGDG